MVICHSYVSLPEGSSLNGGFHSGSISDLANWLILVILMLICWLNVIYIYIYICGIQLDFMGISGD